jgi:chloramphenicol 3-O-phosphotransferase
MNRFVVVSGLPASGKSTIGAALAEHLGLPLYDKDVFLEALFAEHGIGDPEWRGRLSRIADEKLIQRVSAAEGAVICSWWRHPRSEEPTGTPTQWLSGLSGRLVEVHCRCAPEIAARRFFHRQRHPGHLDARKSLDELAKRFAVQSAFGALGVGTLIEVNTEGPVDFPLLCSGVDLAFGVAH